MDKTTVRFSPSAKQLIRDEAEREGISMSEFVRDAAIVRAAFRQGFRREPAGLNAEHMARVLSRSH